MTGSVGDRTPQLLDTLRRKLELKGHVIELRVLTSAKAEMIEEGYDNWDGGQFFYTLYLDIPVELLVEIEDKLVTIEKRLLSEIESLRFTKPPQFITSVTIRSSPVGVNQGIPLANPSGGQPAAATWESGLFRLFLSHVSTFKAEAHGLKTALREMHISAFVAHDSIEPTSEWQIEIEAALQSMDALAALLTSDFVSSRWCDQEVGIAMGLRKLVIPIRIAKDPHGFLGKYQGLSATGKSEKQIAQEIFTVLVRHDVTRMQIAAVAVDRFRASVSYADAKKNMTLLEHLPVLTTQAAARVREAIKLNSQVAEAISVPKRVERLLTRHGFAMNGPEQG